MIHRRACLSFLLSEKIKLRVVRDFDPKQMDSREETELRHVLCSGRLMKKIKKVELYERKKEEERLAEFTMVMPKEIGNEQRHVLDQNERHEIRFTEFEMREDYDIAYDREACDWEYDESLQEFSLHKHDKQINPDEYLLALGNKGHSKRADTTDLQNQEEATELRDFDSYIENYKQVMYDLGYIKCKDNPYTVAITIKRGDELETIPPTDIR